MDSCILEQIQSVEPQQCERERWLQYHALTRSLFPLVPTKDMDAVCRAVAERLGL